MVLTRGFAGSIMVLMLGETPQPPTPQHVEWVTVALVLAWCGAVTAVVVAHASLPWFVSVPVLAVLSAFQFSLQHEAIHGHPTPWRWVNVALVGLPLALWCPYRDYRTSHLRHHAATLTVPGIDPESYYVTVATWGDASPLRRALLRANRTLAGRMVIGPWMLIASTLRRAAADWRLPIVRATWVSHLAVAAATAWLVIGIAGLPAWEYLVGIVWGGTALTMVRSFAEHREVRDGTQSAVVRSNALFSILYLNNNLHHTHHARPGAPWYRLPGLHEELGSDEAARSGAGWYRGYGEVARRYLFRPFGDPVHPAELGSPTSS